MDHSPLLSALTHASMEQVRWQLLLIGAALGLGLGVGLWVERHLLRAPSWTQALRTAFRQGVALPLISLLGLQLLRHGSPELLRAGLLREALPILGVWFLVRVAARAARRMLPDAQAARFAVRLVIAASWSGLLLYLVGALPEIREALDAVSLHVGHQRLTGWTLLRGTVSVLVTLVIALWVSSLLESRLLATPLDVNLRLVLSRLLRAAVFTIALLTALQTVGIDLTVLSVFGGALGVGLGLGLQRIAANYVSGFVILLERSLRVGDNVRLESFQGRIVDIKTRYTLVRSPAGTESIVPNELLISSRIENLSYTDPNVWLSTTVQVGYGSDLDEVLELLRRTVSGVPRVLQDPPPSAVLSSFAADGLEVTLGYWISDPENGTLNVRGAINLAVWRALREAGVEIPFAQRVLQWAPGHAPSAAPVSSPGPAPGTGAGA